MKETKLMELYINEAGNVQCRWDKSVPLNVMQAGDMSNYLQMVQHTIVHSLSSHPSLFQDFPAPEEKMPWE